MLHTYLPDMQNRHRLLVQQHEKIYSYSILSVLLQTFRLMPTTTLQLTFDFVKNVKIKQQTY